MLIGHAMERSAKIYQPSKNAMQSGTAKSKHWLLSFDKALAKSQDPLMGWTSSSDMLQQVQLSFASREEAEAYAKDNGIAYRVEEPQRRRRNIQAYADNFR